MKIVKIWGLVLALAAGGLASVIPADAKAAAPRDDSSCRMSRRSASGRIAVRAGRKRFPANAEVSLSRTRANNVMGRIKNGLKKRRGHHEGRGKCDPSVLAMYDISIRAGGRKWQPDAGDPVRVTVDLEEPVTVTSSALGVAHLADDGTVEELASGKYGFTYNADKTVVTSFWFDATGFSVYAITEGETHKTDSVPARRLYDFYSLDFDTTSDTYNTYIPRYFRTQEGNYTFRQIVTNNQYLVRPEALPSPLGRTFMGWYLYSTNNANKTVDGIAYDADGYATTPFDFEDPVVFKDGETGETEYILRSQFDRVGYVIFHEQPVGDDWPITAVRRGIMEEVETGVMEASVKIDDIKVTYDDTAERKDDEQQGNTAPRMIFRGWSDVKVYPGSETNVNGGAIVLQPSPYVFRRTKDTTATPRHLFPVFVNINWLSFSAAETGQGATYIPPRFYYADEGTNRFPVPLRTGYAFAGWYTAAEGGVRVSDANGVLNTSAALPADWGGHIESGRLMLSESTVLYGHWTPVETKYVVAILQQSVEDDAGAPDRLKTYAFYTNFVISAYVGDTATVANSHKQMASAAATRDDFTGFWYRDCDPDTTVRADGSTVLYVYYDRYKVVYTFNSSDSSASQNIYIESLDDIYTYTAATNDFYTYTATAASYYTYTRTTDPSDGTYLYSTSGYTSNSNGRSSPNSAATSGTEYYGYVDGQYVRVYSVKSGSNYYWSTRSGSTSSSYLYKNGTIYTRSATPVTLYGVSNGVYFELSYASGTWKNKETGATYTGNRYTRAVNTGLGTLYGKSNNDYFPLAYDAGSDEWQNATNNAAYAGTRYTRAETNPGATYYGVKGDVDPRDTTPLVVTYEDGIWCTNGAKYAGVRYTRTVNDLGVLYGASDGVNPYNGVARIYFVNDAWRTSNSASGTVYTGKRYYIATRDLGSWKPMTSLDYPSMTGLYGQRLTDCGYSWPVAYAWLQSYSGSSASGTVMTYLDAFNEIASTRSSTDSSTHTIFTPFFYSGNNGTGRIYHVLQGLDGKYSEANAVETKVSGTGTFNVTDKFAGFTAYAYSLGSFTSNPVNLVSDGGSVARNSQTLYIYHKRRTFTLSFRDSYNDNVYREYQVYYGAPISQYVPSESPTPTEPTMQAGYSFTKWFYDRDASTPVRFTTMPLANLYAYAGWETQWFLIEIDPNGGELMRAEPGSAANQSTWFWEPYNGDPIVEYTTVTRPFEESATEGTYFYAKQDRDYYGLSDEWSSAEDNIKDRGAYYTTDQMDPAKVDDRRYRPAQNVYRYGGWYEVMPDGSEQLYAFGQPVQRNTLLRLHWKHLGTYRLHYEAGRGQISMGDENETILESLDTSVYADSSEILVTRTAVPPDGYSFAGWRIRYGDATVYHPGQTFLFNSAYTRGVYDSAAGRTVNQLTLDAVYTQVRTVALTTDANGGTIDGSVATTLPLAYPNAPTLITNITETTRTVSGMRNNAYGHLSDGKGYENVLDGVSLPFLGWNTAPDGSGTHFAPGQYVGVDTLGTPDENGRNVLYAEWGVMVYFDKNNVQADWNDAAWPTNFSFDAEKGMYCQTNKLNACAENPGVALVSSNENEMFRYWGVKRYSGADLERYDFSQPITNASLTLYAVWSNRIEVQVHAVDASARTPVGKDAEWLTDHAILMNVDTVESFETSPTAYAGNVPEGYAYAFTCLGDGNSGHAGVSAEMAVTNIYYNLEAEHVYVTLANGESVPMPDDKEIYVVYYQSPKTVDIGYKVMEMDGSLRNASVRNTAPTAATVGEDAVIYDMTAHLATPRGYLSGESHDKYAYAIGVPDASGVLQLHFITWTSGSDTSRPALKVRNSWRGYQYSIDGGTTWIDYGYLAQFYVLYFDYEPVVVTLNERTLGTAADMAEQFVYSVIVEQTLVTNTTPNQMRTRTYSNGIFGWGAGWGDWNTSTLRNQTTVTASSTVRLLDETCELANGQKESFTVFSDDDGYTTDWMPAVSSTHVSGVNTQYQTNYTVTVNISQTIRIVQTAKDGFSTVNDGAGGDGKLVYTYTKTGDDHEADQNVTFTNTHIAEPVELHVAAGLNGVLSSRDGDLRSGDAAAYLLSVTNGAANAVAFGADAPAGLFAGDAARYRFMGLFYGKTNENGVVVQLGTNAVTSVAFAPAGDEGYFGLYLNGDTAISADEWAIFAVYAEIPRLYYMKEGANGTLSAIDPITYNGSAVVVGGVPLAQGEDIDVDADSVLTISTTGAGNHIVPSLLDGMREGRPMSRSAFAAGPAGATAESGMDGLTSGAAISIRFDDFVLKWSFDGETWNAFSGSPAIYSIYKEPGFDLAIAQNVLAAEADRSVPFTVTITSENLADGEEYPVSGYTADTIAPVDGAFTFTVTNGSRITIHTLPDNDLPYTVVEAPVAGYVSTNLLVSGYAPLSPVANGAVTMLTENKTVEFTQAKIYTVSFVDEDGATVLLAPAEYAYGTKSFEFAAPATPLKVMDAANIYRFTGWSPALEDVGSNTVYTAAYRTIKIPHATQRAAETNITVSLSREEAQAKEEALIAALSAAGIDILAPGYDESAANETLNARDPNGLRRWENLVTGTGTNQLLLSTAAAASASQTTMGLAYEPSGAVDFGYTVRYELRKWTGGGWKRSDDVAQMASPAFSLALLNGAGDPTGYYRVFTLIVPDSDLSITNEIPSTNTVGLLRINSTAKHTMAAVPFLDLPKDPALNEPIKVVDYVGNGFVKDGDVIRLREDGIFKVWAMEGGKFEPFTSVKANGISVEVAGAAEAELVPGRAVWVTRADHSKPFTIVGQFTGRPVTNEVAGATTDESGKTVVGATMIANPCLSALAINDIAWGNNPADGDTIEIPPTVTGTLSTRLKWYPKLGCWGGMKPTLTRNPTTGRYEASIPTNFEIPAGMGFWYYRASESGFSVIVKPEENLD
ncbi:MAG: InlB B-repeat-containing protein [Kiritimatiellae bacterium]|nr:InlB B-repeat-containing protein [Kiritimatiellia bacterium]